jgi:hypothetical protein
MHILLCNEQRVFQDRLVNAEDQDWFRDLVENSLQSHFDIGRKNLFLGLDSILYADFISGSGILHIRTYTHTVYAPYSKNQM